MSLRLITDQFVPDDSYEYIHEEKNASHPATLYIKGPYMMAEGVNKNKRLYPIHEMVREVSRYTNEMIKPQRSMGELNHSSVPEVNPERACHMVVELNQDGNVFYGKSKVLSTPMGLIVKSLINDGVKLGMSSRALGGIVEEGGISRVNNLRLICIDCVADPSFPKAFVNGILESKQYVLGKDGKYEEIYDVFEEAISTLPRKEVETYLKNEILSFIKQINVKI